MRAISFVNSETACYRVTVNFLDEQCGVKLLDIICFIALSKDFNNIKIEVFSLGIF